MIAYSNGKGSGKPALLHSLTRTMLFAQVSVWLGRTYGIYPKYLYILTLSLSHFRRHLLSVFFFVVFVFCFCFLNKLLLGKKFICKVERLNVKQRRSR